MRRSSSCFPALVLHLLLIRALGARCSYFRWRLFSILAHALKGLQQVKETSSTHAALTSPSATVPKAVPKNVHAGQPSSMPSAPPNAPLVPQTLKAAQIMFQYPAASTGGGVAWLLYLTR